MHINGAAHPQYAIGAKKSAQSLKNQNNQLKTILERLSTAQRINRASDDAAGLSISEQLRSSLRGFKAATQNVEYASSALSIADGAANEISSMMQRQRQLSIAASSDTLSNSDRRALDSEYQALTQEIDRIAGGTQYNRLHTSDGTDLASGDASIQAGSEAGDAMTLPHINMGSAAAGIEGSSIATADGAREASQRIDEALVKLGEQRSTIGATINRFTSTVNNLSVAMVNTQAAESVLRDQDMAQGIMQLATRQLLSEGAQVALQRFNDLNRNQIAGLLG